MSVIKNLLVKQDDFELRCPHLELPDFGVIGLQGPSGAGKSTFAKALLGIVSIASGEWIVDGVDVLNVPVANRRLGVVFQDYGLFPHMSARQNIFFAATARGTPAGEAEKLYAELSSVLGLQLFENTKANKLSGGESQRVALARALMGRPRFLILDEPFTALDSSNRTKARQLCKEIIERTKTPTLLITHDESDLQSLTNSVLHIENGVVLPVK